MPRQRPIGDAQYRALATFRHALRHFLHFSEQAARTAGLEPQQHQALLAIRGAGRARGLGIGELAEQLLVHHNSAVGLVDRLQALGAVRRRGSPEDRRRVRVVLTARGTALLARIAGAHRDELRRLGPHLSALLETLERPQSVGPPASAASRKRRSASAASRLPRSFK